ncbi:hypothetical protein [uncultured Pseudoflavonifractor sp.]|uniref:hypothetical protein n=1 Tax=uncultured Pseudoflavonifractor sp. TaxID=1221379 RepID=UPI0025F4A9CD|nr:hypothetical protein [uncultured Pseudoflavonifractor sp.]
MSRASERLLEAMNSLPDATLEENVPVTAGKKRRWKRWAALAACLAVVVLGAGVFTGIIPLLGGRAGQGGSGSDGASVFMSYAGPVFPLTLGEENAAIEAERNVTLDFEPWAPVWISNREEADSRTWLTEAERQEVLELYNEHYPEGGQYKSSTDILVTDAYMLTNTSAEEQTLTVRYPFVSGLDNLEENRPTLTADGTELETTLRVGSYAGGFEGVWGANDPEGTANLAYPHSWTDYQTLLSDGSYLENTLGPGPDVTDVPVVVYKLTDPYGPEQDEEAGITNPTLRVTFNLDYDKTNILTYGFHGASYDREAGVMIQDFSIPQPGEPNYGTKEFYLLVLGEDVENMTIQGYANGSLEADAPRLEGCGATVERYESDLDTMLRQLLPLIWEEAGQEGADFEMYYRAFLEQLLSYGVLSDEPVERYDTGWLENIEGGMVRVCWLESEVTVPAGGTVSITAAMTKEGSYDFHCAETANQGVYGYDLVTRLGSNLACSVQTATLEDRGQIEIVRQNFGFDLERGITTVPLDPAEEHYYLEVRAAGNGD